MEVFSKDGWLGSSNVKLALCAVAVLEIGLAVGYFIGRRVALGSRCNRRIKLDAEKIVDAFDIEDFDTKKIFCRCWNSKTFPYCDGSHIKHNKATGDNVGPLIINSAPKVEKLN